MREGTEDGERTADGEETADGEGDNGWRCITAFRNIKYTINLTYDIIGAIS